MLSLDCSRPNANETSWVGYRDPAASDPLPLLFFLYRFWIGSSFGWFMLFPSNKLLSDSWRWRVITGLGAQELPNKTAELSRDRHHCFVALETSPEQTRVAMVQTILRSPTDGAHLMRLPLLTPA